MWRREASLGMSHLIHWMVGSGTQSLHLVPWEPHGHHRAREPVCQLQCEKNAAEKTGYICCSYFHPKGWKSARSLLGQTVLGIGIGKGNDTHASIVLAAPCTSQHLGSPDCYLEQMTRLLWAGREPVSLYPRG